ncbi:restriction endonuclease subunit S [Paenibacillus sp. J22TS3]|uniref:restriction endonuclease subunit S n=1 Tax=Paenibacillus sp. J22TS3 TaxID=2807192 RepID=UPI001B1F71A3|nr:restriction endonuclease subunit S [Paenibacillus sp. J22TS3]GIP22907.1 restriction endonuclease subunit S [Paenibacillus sp. J22TS3]
MSKWEKVKLMDICDLNMGQSPESSSYNQEGEGIPFYQGNADFGDLHPKTRYFCNKPTKIAKRDDLLLSVRAPIGALNIATETCCIGRGLAALTPRGDLLDTKFLYYVLKLKHTELNLKGTGSTFKAINKQSLSEILCPLPPLETQKKIAKTLDTAAELLAMHKQQLAELDKLVKSTFYDLFGDPVANEKGWNIGIIKDLALKIQYGTSEKASTEKLSYPILRMNNLTYEGNMDFSDMKYIDLSEKDLEKYLVHKGEMLFNRTNSKELVGKTAVFREVRPMAYAGYLVRLVPNDKANCEFISAYLNSSYGKKLLFKMAKNIVGMANINAKELGNIKIYIPPIELQSQFATIVTQIEEQKSLVKKAINETQYLFDSLMSEYFE